MNLISANKDYREVFMGNGLYFIYGSEDYLLAENIKQIIAAVKEQIGEDTEVVSYFGDELSPAGLVEALDFSPLFTLSRVVVIKRAPWFGTGKKKSRPSSEYQQVLEQYLQNPAAQQVVIITANEFQIQNTFTKLLINTAVSVQCVPYNKEQRRRWLQTEAEKNQKTFQKDALSLLANSSHDLFYLKHLLDKLCLMVKGDKITIDDLQDQWHQEEDIKVFKLLEALLNKNLATSMSIYQRLLRQGEHPVFFLYMMVRQFLLMGKVKALQEKGWDRQKIVAYTGQKEFVVRSLEGKTQNFTWPQLRALNRSFLQTDLHFKTTGQDNNLLMENLIVEICCLL